MRKSGKVLRASICTVIALLILMVLPAYAGSLIRTVESRVSFNAIDLNDRGSANGYHYDDYDMLNFYLNKTYEVRMIYDFSDEIDFAAARISISIPDTSGNFWSDKEMWLSIDDLNGNSLVRYQVVLRSSHLGDVPITIVGNPTFFSEDYPDGVELSEKLFTDGVILNDIPGIEKGYIAFRISTEPEETEETNEPKENDSWMVYLSICILAGALVVAIIANNRLERQRRKK